MNPTYIIILSLISSLLIIKPKNSIVEKYFKFFLFMSGFLIILFSEISYRFIYLSTKFELFFISLPLFFILFFYTTILLKTKFNLRYL